MRVAIIRITAKFERQYKKLPREVKEAAKRQERIFCENAFDHQLRTHKLHGADHDAWAFSVTRTYRIKFIFLTATSALFLDVGTHDIYR